jgi:hydrogenase maturation factor
MTPQPLPPPGHHAVTVPACHEDVCITCSDQAVRVTVRQLLAGELAVVDTEGGPEQVSVALVEARPGDVLLVHAKEAIAVVERAS